jgi:hypothetical protein
MDDWNEAKVVLPDGSRLVSSQEEAFFFSYPLFYMHLVAFSTTKMLM